MIVDHTITDFDRCFGWIYGNPPQPPLTVSETTMTDDKDDKIASLQGEIAIYREQLKRLADSLIVGIPVEKQAEIGREMKQLLEATGD